MRCILSLFFKSIRVKQSHGHIVKFNQVGAIIIWDPLKGHITPAKKRDIERSIMTPSSNVTIFTATGTGLCDLLEKLKMSIFEDRCFCALRMLHLLLDSDSEAFKAMRLRDEAAFPLNN